MVSASSLSTSRRDHDNAWELETPGPVTAHDDPDAGLLLQEDFDRDFYVNQDDDGHYVLDATATDDNAGTLGRFLFTNPKLQQRHAQLLQSQQSRQQQPQRQSARASQMQDDQEKWEANRLASAGAMSNAQKTLLDQGDSDQARVTLLVHHVKPPFLDGRVSFSRQQQAVPTVRDASSDFAKMARQGSATLQQLRADRDLKQMRQKFWELGGTRMGQAVGVKDEAKDGGGDTTNEGDATEATTDNGEVDYKKSAGYASHMKKNEKVSAFSKSKSIQEQRAFLPVFSVREELLTVIREHNVVVIVGETGSGKVCTTRVVDGCVVLLAEKA